MARHGRCGQRPGQEGHQGLLHAHPVQVGRSPAGSRRARRPATAPGAVLRLAVGLAFPSGQSGRPAVDGLVPSPVRGVARQHVGPSAAAAARPAVLRLNGVVRLERALACGPHAHVVQRRPAARAHVGQGRRRISGAALLQPAVGPPARWPGRRHALCAAETAVGSVGIAGVDVKRRPDAQEHPQEPEEPAASHELAYSGRQAGRASVPAAICRFRARVGQDRGGASAPSSLLPSPVADTPSPASSQPEHAVASPRSTASTIKPPQEIAVAPSPPSGVAPDTAPAPTVSRKTSAAHPQQPRRPSGPPPDVDEHGFHLRPGQRRPPRAPGLSSEESHAAEQKLVRPSSPLLARGRILEG